MSKSQHQQMRDAIDAVELALNGLEIDAVLRLFEHADDSVRVKVPLGALRQLGRCYPELNRIINDPAFAEGSVKDKALRHSLLIVAKSYLARGDSVGELVHRILTSVLSGAETMDKVLDDTPSRRK